VQPLSAARLYGRCEAFAGQEVAPAERGVEHELPYDAGSGIEIDDADSLKRLTSTRRIEKSPGSAPILTRR